MSSNFWSLKLPAANGGIIPFPDLTVALIVSAGSPMTAGPSPALPPGWQAPQRLAKAVAPAAPSAVPDRSSFAAAAVGTGTLAAAAVGDGTLAAEGAAVAVLAGVG